MGITYYCRPAALWSGTVGHALIRFHLRGLGPYLESSLDHEGICVSLYPAGWRRIGYEEPGGWMPPHEEVSRTYKWEFEDWNPTEDVGFRVDWHCWQDRTPASAALKPVQGC